MNYAFVKCIPSAWIYRHTGIARSWLYFSGVIVNYHPKIHEPQTRQGHAAMLSVAMPLSVHGHVANVVIVRARSHYKTISN